MIIEDGNVNGRVFDETIELKDNAMLRRRPELFSEWDFEKNDEIGLEVYRMTKASRKIAWWTCPDCSSPYDMEIQFRAGKRKSNCPYCRGLRVNWTNSLASLHPDIAKEWHPTFNGDLKPDDVTYGKNKKVWWLGGCGHWWDAGINERIGQKQGCPICSNRRFLLGFNDMWTTNPELASKLADPEDGYKYMQSSAKRVDWKCPVCEGIIKSKKITNINNKGLHCFVCSDGISFPEKFMYNLLKENNIEFKYDSAKEWAQGKRYDFYLLEYNWIIETHGEQHYGVSFGRIGEEARSLEEEQKNDRIKKKIANENGINNYIIIDARESTVEWIKSSILNSDIMKIASEIDFVKIGQLASSSFVKVACDLWNSGIHSVLEIAKKMNLSKGTIRTYLKRGTEIGWCDYSSVKETKMNGANSAIRKRIEVVQLNMNCSSFIESWQSLSEAGTSLNISIGAISSVCNGRYKTAGGFKWMYKEDYDDTFQLEKLQSKDVG